VEGMKVYLNNPGGGRRAVKADIFKENPRSFLVILPDRHIVLRKKARDILLEAPRRFGFLSSIMEWFKDLINRLESGITPRSTIIYEGQKK